MITLAIETSCDETAVAILRDERELLAHRLYSQIAEHRPHGGVVPEIASRAHLEKLFPLLDAVFAESRIKKEQVDFVAATTSPGLIGCLLVGATLGKALAAAWGKPFIGVNHIEGHLHAPFLEFEEFDYPFVSLTVSGGHTSIYHATGLGEYQTLGRTVDDAAGEVLDKVARLAGLGYPGGPVIDRLSKLGNAQAFRFSRVVVKRGPTFLSFSGLKTEARRIFERDILPSHREISHFLADPERDFRIEKGEVPQILLDFSASFQHAVVTELLDKLEIAAAPFPRDPFSFSGGVSVNSELRTLAKSRFARPLYFSSPKFCTDNAAMIATVAAQYAKRGHSTPLSEAPQARSAL